MFFFRPKKLVLDCFTYDAIIASTAPILPSIRFYPDWLRKVPTERIEEKKGGTFNPKTAIKDDGDLIKRHSTLSYDKLGKGSEYSPPSTRARVPFSAGELNNQNMVLNSTQIARAGGFKINEKIGKQTINDTRRDELLGTIKGNATSDNVDRVNMIPYGQDYINPTTSEKTDDFIKFKFHDMVNNKFIIFRAILEGISDSITPEYGEERYVGRPDKVYIYQGVDRNISFGFKIYPKTKQELPILMEKLNYLVGMCYPSYTPEERMITPLISLTMGDMFDRVTGLLGSLNVTVEDATTWEIDDGLQFPHFISAQCEFKYIGNNVLASKGKHYGINWIPDGTQNPATRFTDKNQLGFEDYPNRKSGGTIDMTPLYKDLSQPAAETTT